MQEPKLSLDSCIAILFFPIFILVKWRNFNMFYLLIGLSLVLGTLAVGLISHAIYWLCSIFLTRFGGIKTHGTITDYTERCYYTKRTPPRLIHNYFPIVKYSFFGKNFRSEYKNILRKNKKAYATNTKKEIYINRKNNSQIIICGYYDCLSPIVILLFGIFYFLFLTFLCMRFFSEVFAEYTNKILLCFIISAVSILLGLIFRILKGYVNNEKMKTYTFIHCVIFAFAVITVAVFK